VIILHFFTLFLGYGYYFAFFHPIFGIWLLFCIFSPYFWDMVIILQIFTLFLGYGYYSANFHPILQELKFDKLNLKFDNSNI